MGIEKLIKGEEVNRQQGTFYQIETSAGSLGADCLSKYIFGHRSVLDSSKIFEAFGLKDVADTDIGFLDIETLGLNASDIIFLVSYGQFTPNDFKISSFLARDPGEERAVLACTLEHLHESRAVCTFNGKNFDIDRLSKRSRQQGLMINGFRYKPLEECLRDRHIDLRYHFKKGNLQSLERSNLHYVRRNDLPGKKIPAVYNAYVWGSDSHETDANMLRVIYHNQVDVSSLASMLLYACEHTQLAREAREHAPVRIIDNSTPLLVRYRNNNPIKSVLYNAAAL